MKVTEKKCAEYGKILPTNKCSGEVKYRGLKWLCDDCNKRREEHSKWSYNISR